MRVRERVLPVLERELGPGIAEALARTAEQLREDAEALDALRRGGRRGPRRATPRPASRCRSRALATNPPALRQRIIRLVVASEFGVSLSRAQTLEVARLVTDWHGQAGVDLPGVRVVRRAAGSLVFSAAG